MNSGLAVMQSLVFRHESSELLPDMMKQGGNSGGPSSRGIDLGIDLIKEIWVIQGP